MSDSLYRVRLKFMLFVFKSRRAAVRTQRFVQHSYVVMKIVTFEPRYALPF